MAPTITCKILFLSGRRSESFLHKITGTREIAVAKNLQKIITIGCSIPTIDFAEGQANPQLIIATINNRTNFAEEFKGFRKNRLISQIFL